jgi:tetratricopeptide (TPR) repeat protein
MSEQHQHKDSSFFEKYFSKNTSPQEKASMRESVASDSFEAEAMEGFESLENDAEALSAIRDIQQRVAKKTGHEQSHKVVFPVWKSISIAASIAVFVVAGFAISNMLEEDKSVAKNENSESIYRGDASTSEVEEQGSSFYEQEEDQSLGTLDVAQDAEQLEKRAESVPDEMQNEVFAKDEQRQPAPISMDIPEISMSDLPLEQLADEEFEVVDEMIVEEAQTIVSNDLVENEIATSGEEAFSLSAVAKTTTESVAFTESNYARGKSSYNDRNYSEAIDYFQKAINSDEKVNESNYYMAMSFFVQNKNSKALKHFNVVLNSNSALRFNAMWYKAIILEESGDLAGAKKILEELANGSSGFKSQAADKLKAFD